MAWKKKDTLKKAFETLKEIEQNLLIIDFSHFSPKENDGKNYNYDLFLNCYTDCPSIKKYYYNYLFNFFSNKNSVWKRFSEDSKRKYFYSKFKTNIEPTGNEVPPDNIYIEILDENSKIQDGFKPRKDLISSIPKLKCDCEEYSIVIMHNIHNNAQSIVYAIFSGEVSKKSVKKELRKILYDEMINSLLEEKYYFTEEFHKSLLHASISQIFARNFAHNIGSHVAIRATNRAVKNRLKDLYTEGILQESYATDWLDEASERLDLYEVQRNEFLADVNLSAKNMMLYRDVILPFCENTLILDNIAHSENIQYEKGGYKNKLKIKTYINGYELSAKYEKLRNKDGDSKICYPDNFPYLLKAVENETLESGFLNKKIIGTKNNQEYQDCDVEISLGSEHALYSIFENFIRNCSKHNVKKEKSKEIINKDGLKIILNIKDENDDYFLITLSDNVSKVTYEKLCEFQKSINETLKYNNGTIEKKNLGIADMMINAFLLQTSDDISEENLKNVLELVYSEDGEIFNKFKKDSIVKNNEDFSFGYRFKLCKSKKVLWLRKTDYEEKEQLQKKGIILQEHLEAKTSISTPIAKYQFAIIEPDLVLYLTNKSPVYDWDNYLIKLPHRVLLNITKNELDKTNYVELKDLVKDKRIQCVSSKFETPNLSGENWDFHFLKTCWENWLRKWDICSENKGRLVINLEEKDQATSWTNQLPSAEQSDFVKFDFLYKEDGNYSKSVENVNKIDDNQKLVIYDRHAGAISSLHTNEKLKQDCSKFIRNRFYINFDKSSLDFVNLYYCKNIIYDNYLFLLNAFEAGITRVAILDERITEKLKLDDNNTKNIKKEDGFNSFESVAGEKGYFADLANNSNTFIFSHFKNKIIETIPEDEKFKNFNFKIENLDPKIESLRRIDLDFENKSDILSSSIGIDAIIIHRTFLLSLLDAHRENDSAEILNCLYKKYKRVIIVSGGGQPHSLKFPVHFKSFSLLETSIQKYPSKISLINII